MNGEVLHTAPELDPYHQMQFSFFSRILFFKKVGWRSDLSARDTVSILSSNNSADVLIGTLKTFGRKKVLMPEPGRFLFCFMSMTVKNV